MGKGEIAHFDAFLENTVGKGEIAHNGVIVWESFKGDKHT